MGDSSRWDEFLVSSARRDADVVVVAPPALTFEDNCYNGRPARACRGAGVYGVPGLPADVKASVTIETILWKRAAEFINCMYDNDVPWILIVPLTGSSSPVPTDLEELDDVLGRPGIRPQFIGLRSPNGIRAGPALNIYTFGVDLQNVKYDSDGLYIRRVCQEVWKAALKSKLSRLQRSTGSVTPPLRQPSLPPSPADDLDGSPLTDADVRALGPAVGQPAETDTSALHNILPSPPGVSASCPAVFGDIGQGVGEVSTGVPGSDLQASTEGRVHFAERARPDPQRHQQ